MIYEPAEDSYLLKKEVEKFARGKKVLDVGVGNGIQAETALKNGAKSVLAVDIDKESIEFARQKGIKCIKSNLLSAIDKKEKFDLIIFNPPYLPLDIREDAKSRKSTTGGKKGDEIVLRFLKEAGNHLTEKGIILLVLSSLTPTDRINKCLIKNKLKKEILSEKKFFFEKIGVWKITKI